MEAAWFGAVASSLVVSMAVTRPERDAASLALIVGGLACSPLLSQMNKASTAMANGSGLPEVGKSAAMLMVAMMVAVVYGASLNVCPPKWDLGVGALVAAALTSGMLAGIGMPVTSEILFGVVLLPVVYLGLWLGANIRGKKDVEEGSDPGRMAVDASLGLVIALCAMWLTKIYLQSKNLQTLPALPAYAGKMNEPGSLVSTGSSNYSIGGGF